MVQSNTFMRLHRRPWLVPLITMLLAGVLTFLVTSLLPRTFRSEASLYFPSSGDSSGSLLNAVTGLSRFGNVSERGGQVSLFGGALISPQVASAPQTAIGVLASQKLRERVSTKLDLRRRWEVSSYRAVKRLSDVVTPAVDKN